jgi:hypothetical protein
MFIEGNPSEKNLYIAAFYRTWTPTGNTAIGLRN